MDDKKEIPAFNIRKIKEFSFMVNESLFEVDKPVRIQFQHQTTYHVENNFVNLILRVYYYYYADIAADAPIDPNSILVDFNVQNVFEVPELSKYLVEGFGFILPKKLMASIVGVSISHTRSLMAHNISGTVYQNNIIPIIDPFDVTEAFYPNMFQEKNTEIINPKQVKKSRSKKN